MAVHIRLRRIGKNPKKNAHFRISAYDQRRGRDSKSIEEMGFYNPVTGSFKINLERFDYWVQKGAQISATIKGLVKKHKTEAGHAASSS